MPHLRVVLMLALVGSLLMGCTSAPPDPTGADSASAHPPHLTVTLLQYRTDEGTNVINAQTTNQGDEPVTVTSVVLRSPVIEPIEPTPKDTTFAPGQIIDLRTEYGAPVCSEGDQDRAASFDVVLSDGTTLNLPLDAGGQDWIDRLFDHDCAVERVEAIASITFGTRFVPVTVDGERYLSGDLVVQRPERSTDTATSRDRLTVYELEGSVLVSFDPESRSTLPITLMPGVATVRVPVLLGSSNRCDSHAFAESKQTFLLSAFVRTEGAPAQRVIVTPDNAVQGQTLHLVSALCASSH